MSPSAPPEPSAGSPSVTPRLPEVLGPWETAVWVWRRLRRMSTALYLLLALAAVTVVSTFVPQEPVIPTTVAAWRAGTDGPGEDVAAFFDTLGLFDIFGTWWFNTLVVLLVVSLVGCLVPRGRGYWRQVRRPPVPGRNLHRLTHHVERDSDLPPEQAAQRAEAALRTRRLRVRRIDADSSPTGHAQVAAERGHAREGGSLAFHVSFFVLLAGAIIGHTFGFEGQVNVVEGEAFADTPVGYDRYEPGRFWDQRDHPGFTVRLDQFTTDFHTAGATTAGAQTSFIASDFRSEVTVLADGRQQATGEVSPNEPFGYQGINLYQIRFGYAPELTVTTAEGTELYTDTTNLVEQDGFVWTGTAAVDRTQVDQQIALELALLPDADIGDDGMPYSRTNQLNNPRLAVSLWFGPLGLERNRPVSEFDRDAGTRLRQPLILAPGESGEFEPLGLEVSFNDMPYWSGFQVAREPGRGLLLAGAGLMLAGLIPSLYAYRRRIWVDIAPHGTGSRVLIAGVARQRKDAFAERWPRIEQDVTSAVQARPEDHLPTDTEPAVQAGHEVRR